MKSWGELDERLDPAFYHNIMLLNKNIVLRAVHPVSTFKQKVSMQRGRFGHRPRNDPRYYNGIYPFIQTGNIVKASTTNEKIEFTQTLNELGLSTSRLFEEKVVVITIAANIGYTAILDYPACFPDSLVALTSKDNELSLEYLNVYVRFIRLYIENLAPQAAQKNINLKQMSKLPIIIPNRESQKLIVSIMERAYTEKVKKEKRAQNLLESINDFLLRELGIVLSSEGENTLKSRMFYVNSSNILGGRFDPNYYKGDVAFNDSLLNGKYPVCEFRKIIALLSNGVEIRNYSESGFRYLRVSDMSKNGIVNDNVRYVAVDCIPHKIRLSLNDILISRSGSLGLVSVVTEEIVDSILSSHIFRVRLLDLVDKYYLQEFLRSQLGQHQFFKLNNGGIIPEINQNALGTIKICLPPIEKQQEIAEHIIRIRTESEKLLLEADTSLAIANQQIEKILIGEKL